MRTLYEAAWVGYSEMARPRDSTAIHLARDRRLTQTHRDAEIPFVLHSYRLPTTMQHKRRSEPTTASVDH